MCENGLVVRSKANLVTGGYADATSGDEFSVARIRGNVFYRQENNGSLEPTDETGISVGSRREIQTNNSVANGG